jgi:peptidoglycan/LPS O-acetylase OafA/YrhL
VTEAGTTITGAPRPPIPDRVGALDGLRGWAALGVLLFHMMTETFGEVFPVYKSWWALIATGGGGMAVCTFFVTSGYLLTIHRWYVADNKRLIVQLFKRYVRLTVPIIASALIFWAVLTLDLDWSDPAGQIVDREKWLSLFGRVQPDIVAALTFALWRNYILSEGQNYGPFLWTMAVQLWGSIIVMSIAYGQRVLREPYSPLLFFSVVLLYIYPYLACMPLGALIALLQRDGLLFRNPPGRVEGLVATALFLGCLVASSLVEGFETGGREEWKWDMIVQTMLSVLFVAAAIRSTPLAGFLSNRVSRFMGRVSFPIYLTQCALLISLTSWLIVTFDGMGQLTEWTALAIVVISVVATLLASWAFLPIETFATWLVRRIDGKPRSTSVSATA